MTKCFQKTIPYKKVKHLCGLFLPSVQRVRLLSISNESFTEMKDSDQRIPLQCIEECKNIKKLTVLVEKQKFLELILKLPVLLPSNYRKNIDYNLLLILQHRNYW